MRPVPLTWGIGAASRWMGESALTRKPDRRRAALCPGVALPVATPLVSSATSCAPARCSACDACAPTTTTRWLWTAWPSSGSAASSGSTIASAAIAARPRPPPQLVLAEPPQLVLDEPPQLVLDEPPQLVLDEPPQLVLRANAYAGRFQCPASVIRPPPFVRAP